MALPSTRRYSNSGDSCYACSIRCKPVDEITAGPYPVDPTYGGPEYETLYAFGSSCGIGNLSAVAYANQLCNMYGMDTISCGATIAWAMDCFEKGLITERRYRRSGSALREYHGHAPTGGEHCPPDRFRQPACRRFRPGGRQARARHAGTGRGGQKQELPAHMPTTKPGLGLIYAVNPFGADHQSSEHDPAYTFYPDRARQLGLEKPQAGNLS